MYLYPFIGCVLTAVPMTLSSKTPVPYRPSGTSPAIIALLLSPYTSAGSAPMQELSFLVLWDSLLSPLYFVIGTFFATVTYNFQQDYPVAELILTPSATPKPVLIAEGMVSNMLNMYKSHFPTDTSKNRKKSQYKYDLNSFKRCTWRADFWASNRFFYAWDTSCSMGLGILIFRGP